MVLKEVPPPTTVRSDSRRAEGRSDQRRSSRYHSRRLIELPHSRSHRCSHREESRHARGPLQHSERSRRESTRRSTLRPSIGILGVPRESNSRRPSRHDSIRTPTQRQLEPDLSYGRSGLRRNATVSYRRSGLPSNGERPSHGSGREEVSVIEKIAVGIKRFIIPERNESIRREPYADGPSHRETGRSLFHPSRSNKPFSRNSRKCSSIEPSRRSRNPFSRNKRRNSFANDEPEEDWELVEEIRVYREHKRGATEKKRYLNTIDEDRNILHREHCTESELARHVDDADTVHWKENKNGEVVPKEVWYVDRPRARS